MIKRYSNPCVRCGRERVLLKTCKEKIDNSVITVNYMVCPDKECQDKVDKDNEKIRKRNALMRLKSEQRIKNRKTRGPNQKNVKKGK